MELRLPDRLMDMLFALSLRETSHEDIRSEPAESGNLLEALNLPEAGEEENIGDVLVRRFAGRMRS